MADDSKNGILGHLPPLPRPALNNSVSGMGEGDRQRKGLTLLTDADIEALKAGQPMPCWFVRSSGERPASHGTCTNGSGGGTSGRSDGKHQRGSC